MEGAFILGLWLGGGFGFFACAMLMAGKRSDFHE